MYSNYGTRILSAGSGLPDKVLSNADFEKYLDTNDEWIRTRTGIETRRIADASKGESTVTFCQKAAENALKKADMSPADLDLIIVGTVTPDTVMPTTANQLQARLGNTKAFSFDLQAACSGWIYGLSIADNFIKSGQVKNALVVGAETLSTIVDWQDRSTAVLFGDGAGATVLTRTEDPKRRVLSTRVYSDGRYGELLCLPHGYSKVPPYSAEYSNKMHKVKMNGKEIYKHAVRNMISAAEAVMADQNVSTSDVDFFFFHQANLRIIDTCMKTLKVDESKTWLNVSKYGNTSAATLPVCLDEAMAAGKVKEGDLVLMSTFGGGLTWGAALVRI